MLSSLARHAFLLILVLASACEGDGWSEPSDGAVRDGSTRDAGDDDAGEGDADVTGDASEPCSLAPQGGCGVGERCDLSPTNQPRCVPIGTKAEYERCDPDAVDDPCGAGFSCLREPDMGGIAYRCLRFCRTEVSAVQCTAWDMCVARQHRPVAICATMSTCRPLAQDCVDDGSGDDTCYLIETLGARCLPAPANPSPVGGPCESSLECIPGSSCVNVPADPTHRCLAHCDPEAATEACAAGTACEPFGGIGVCRAVASPGPADQTPPSPGAFPSARSQP